MLMGEAMTDTILEALAQEFEGAEHVNWTGQEVADYLRHKIGSPMRASAAGPRTEQPFTQCEKCWQPATCKKYGCREPAAATTTAWLVEWPEDDNVPVRWWNPGTGWMRDANKALWFARERDAAVFIAAGNWTAGIKPTEHVFIGDVMDPRSPSGSDAMREALFSEIRDFLQDIAGGAHITENSVEHAKQFVFEMDALADARVSDNTAQCNHAAIIGLDGKWHCQKCGSAIDIAEAQAAEGGK
jgi:hypothetical protein